MENRFWNKVDIKSLHECWEWTGAKRKHGYGKIMVEDGIRSSGKRRQKDISAHRVSYMIHYGPIPKGFCICHTCDNPGCVNPNHLFLGTLADNNRDMRNKGRQAWGKKVSHPGEKNPSAKLTEKDVKKIRTLYPKQTQTKIANDYGVTQGLIGHIVHRRIWKHI